MDDSYHVSRSIDVESLFASPVAAFELAGPARDFPLVGDEGRTIASASPKRRFEFSSGRACARAALETYGVLDHALCVGEKREPLWPQGFAGSITHTKGYCASVVTPTSTYAGLGIDCEALGRVSLEMERLICSPADLAMLAEMDSADRALHSTLLFSAKEAFYKCQFAMTEGWLGFRDVSLRFQGNRFLIDILKPAANSPLPDGPYEGVFLVSGTHVLTGIAISGEAGS